MTTIDWPAMAKRYPLIPAYTWLGFKRYLEERLFVGGFLTAVIQNNFCTAVCSADDENRKALKQIAQFIHNEMPSKSHGKDNTWLAGSS